MLRELVKGALTALLEKRYEKELLDQNFTYDKWIRGVERESLKAVKTSGEASDKTEERQGRGPEETRQGNGAVMVWYSAKGRLSRYAPFWIKEYFRQHPEVMLAYGDEDVENSVRRERRSPWFKPEWSPDTFCSGFYWGSVVAVRKSWLKGVLRQNPVMAKEMPETAFGCALEPERLAGFVQTLVKEAGGYRRGCTSIGHISKMLYHGRTELDQEDYQRYTYEIDQDPDVTGRTESGGELPERRKVSVIIPSRDNPGLLEQCLGSVIRVGSKIPYEFVVVDNGSSQENRQRIEKLLEALPAECYYLYRPMEFNFSRMCNLGAQSALERGETGVEQYLLFLNDDVEVCRAGWMEAMVRRAALPYVGAVGLKLYYPNSRKMQHAGITNLPMGPVHKLQYLEDDQIYDHGRNRCALDVIAVTGACLMCTGKRFREIDGFNETLRVAFNDVALGFRLYQLGYHNVSLNQFYAYHHESLTRGSDNDSVEKLERLQSEWKRLYALFPELVGKDPYFAEGFNRETLDSGIFPAYLSVGNRPQPFAPVKKNLSGRKLRRDNCLMVGMECTNGQRLQGYSVVLGDNNACYEKTLVMLALPESEAKSLLETLPAEELTPELLEREGAVTYLQPLSGQYRSDLVENLPDQRHVGLGGFWVSLNRKDTGKELSELIPKGSYRLGIMAKNRVSGLRLLNWSNRIWRAEQAE